jgi:hypothetical protein
LNPEKDVAPNLPAIAGTLALQGGEEVRSELMQIVKGSNFVTELFCLLRIFLVVLKL